METIVEEKPLILASRVVGSGDTRSKADQAGALNLARDRLLSCLDTDPSAHLTAAAANPGPSTAPLTLPAAHSEWFSADVVPTLRGETTGGSAPESNSTVVTVSDRKVRIAPDDDDISLYALSRRWVSNDPDAREEKSVLLPMHPALPSPDSEVVTETAPPQEPQKDTIAAYKSSDMTSAEISRALLDEHKAHFLKVRSHFECKRRKKLERFRVRLGMLLPPLPTVE
ncbi:hypothetical protein CYMTET_46887 [Cymbomonas tetramitiformis]|uniref:Uncharacterized protein n=1 Tax=Cymbomonas tetramitiformis TaxID=36881 RepID=A0AAE0BVC6_9CHLO|nr:hypothetical protein CYMTET_46887 [Cymbomonas tetramitiformis]